MNLKPSAVLTIVAGILSASPCACAQDSVNLFLPTDNDDWADPMQEDDPGIIRSRAVNVDFWLLDFLEPSIDGSVLAMPVEFNLFEADAQGDEVSVTVVFDKVQPRWPTTYTGLPVLPTGFVWSGSILNDGGGHATMVTGTNECRANISVDGIGSFRVDLATGFHVVREVCATEESQCNVVSNDEPSDSEDGGGSSGFGPEGGGSGCDDGSMIDIIVLWTEEARRTAEARGRNISAEVDIAVNDMNEAFQDSDINSSVRLLYKAEIPTSVYVESLGDEVQLHELHDLDGVLDHVHSLRNALRADLVCMFTKNGGSFGNLMAEELPAYESEAFSTVLWSSAIFPGLSFPHELGHNLGCWHPRLAECGCGCDGGAYPYSFGYQLDLSKGTIMSSGTRIRYYSNPDVVIVPEGPIGIPAENEFGQPNCDSADNARTINETCDTASQYRRSHYVADETAIHSLTSAGHPALNGNSLTPSISDDGRYVAYTSSATNLFPSGASDTNHVSDVFRHDRELGTVVLMSGKVGLVADGASFASAISGDGRFVSYASNATNLISPADGNGVADVYVRSPDNPDHKRLSVSTSGIEGDNASTNPSISKTGRWIAFESLATNLDELVADTGGHSDIFIRDRDKDADNIFDESGAANSDTVRIRSTEFLVQANASSINPAISSDGNWVAFESLASNLIPAGQDTLGKRDIFVRHRTGTVNIRISNGIGAEANDHSYNASISRNGRFIAFSSDATNLVASDTNGNRDVFLYDRDTDDDGIFDETGSTLMLRASVSTAGVEGNNDSDLPIISGRSVAFSSTATNFESPVNAYADVFVRHNGTTVRASVSSAGVAGNQASTAPAIAGAGRFIAFQSAATNLTIASDTNGFQDVFMHTLAPLGELSGDNAIDSLDQTILLQNWSGPGVPRGCCAADLDGDGDIDVDDLLILSDNAGG